MSATDVSNLISIICLVALPCPLSQTPAGTFPILLPTCPGMSSSRMKFASSSATAPGRAIQPADALMCEVIKFFFYASCYHFLCFCFILQSAFQTLAKILLGWRSAVPFFGSWKRKLIFPSKCRNPHDVREVSQNQSLSPPWTKSIARPKIITCNQIHITRQPVKPMQSIENRWCACVYERE